MRACQRLALPWLLSMLAAFAPLGCSKENAVDQSNNASTGSCAEKPESLAKLCPAGTSLDLSAEAQACAGGGDKDVKDAQGNITARCRTFAGCSVRCALLSVCGNGMCELNERKECKADDKECVPCAKDCGDAVCGDKICNGTENPQTCPQDCAGTCTPGATRCMGSATVLTCSADGKTETQTACPAGKVCGVSGNGATCNDAGVCGNGACETGEDVLKCPQDCKKAACGDGKCESGESVQTCPQDCSNAICGNGKCELNEQTVCPQDCVQLVCKPYERQCIGTKLKVCNANGQDEDQVDCAESDQLCGNGQCVPKNTCSNGICEPGESESCSQDCSAECGDGVCNTLYESPTKCAKDCAQKCGDGTCSPPNENKESCPQDCKTDCGNAVCEAGEDRLNCSSDCGFCGDGACQDGYESPAPFASGNLEPCPIDCTVIACKTDADCDDKIECTVDKCESSGKCSYKTSDALCGSGSKCLGGPAYAKGQLDGCCADKDGDGSASLSCGGNDCYDSDSDPGAANYKGAPPATVHPGAAEQCDGIDRNCNGSNAPVLGQDAAAAVTSNSGDKLSIGVAQAPDDQGKTAVYLLAWAGAKDGDPAVQFAVAGPNGALQSPVQSIPVANPYLNDRAFYATYSPEKKRFALAYRTCSGLNGTGTLDGHVVFIGTDGVQQGPVVDVPIGQCGGSSTSRWLFARAQDSKKAAYTLVTDVGGASYGPVLIGEDGSVSPTAPAGLPANTQGCYNTCYLFYYGYAATPNRFVSINRRHGYWTGGGGSYLDQWRPSGEVLTSPAIAQDGPDGGLFGWDGDALVAFFNADGSAVSMRRLDINTGATLLEQTAAPGNVKPVSLALSGSNPPQVAVVGIPQSDKASVSIFVRNQDGSEALPLGSLAKGNDVTDAHVLWDGTSFRSFFSSKVSSGLHQIHTAALTCN